MIVRYCKECGARDPKYRYAHICDACGVERSETEGARYYILTLEEDMRTQALLCEKCYAALPEPLRARLAADRPGPERNL
jgi:ribosomal protein L40E